MVNWHPLRNHLAPFGRSRLYHVGIYWVYLYPLLKGFNGKGLRLNSGPGPSIPRLTTIFPFQGCRFGPESSRQTLVSSIFRSNCFISSGGGLCFRKCMGQICNPAKLYGKKHTNELNGSFRMDLSSRGLSFSQGIFKDFLFPTEKDVWVSG